MKRTCGMAFILGVLFFFPFPNLLIAPGYQDLPHLRVPSVREVAAEMPAPWNERVVRVMDETSWFYSESIQTAHFAGHCFRNFLFQLSVRLYSSLLTPVG